MKDEICTNNYCHGYTDNECNYNCNIFFVSTMEDIDITRQRIVERCEARKAFKEGSNKILSHFTTLIKSCEGEIGELIDYNDRIFINVQNGKRDAREIISKIMGKLK